jgi:hypothetical protein
MDDSQTTFNCLWNKLKVICFKPQILIDKNEKSKIKKEIGQTVIKLNKEYEKEFLAWCLIFNGYKDKLQLANSHFNQFKLLVEEIRRVLLQMKKVRRMKNS